MRPTPTWARGWSLPAASSSAGGSACRDGSAWSEVLEGLVVPMDAAARTLISHDGWQSNETKGATPSPLAGLFPLGYQVPEPLERATIRRYLGLADGYIGSPMLSPFYGVWAAWVGDRALSLRLLDEGYGQLIGPRFLQTLEMRPDREPEKPNAGPFFANIGGFLSSLLFGFTGIQLTDRGPATWPARPIVLPEGWEAIEVERLWIHGRGARLRAAHGAQRATLTFEE